MEAFQRQVAALAESIPPLRAAVVDFLTKGGVASYQVRWAVALALTEASGNVVRHAYRGEPGSIDVTVEHHDDHVQICVRDTGVGIHNPSPDPGLGLGLALMNNSAEALTMASSAAGTTVTMTFPVSA